MLDFVIILFIILEMLNVLILYFAPDSKRGNGVAVFNQWHQSKEDENAHLFAKYLVNWVAGTKLIFIVLLLVVLLTGSETTKVLSILVLIGAIATYYWRLHPIIKSLDLKGQITPKGYSKTLGVTIGMFITVFLVALTAYFLL